MVRPFNRRRIMFEPGTTYFKPAGIPMSILEEEVLKHDEIEALRLCDAENNKQEEAAKKMNVSQPTIFRILESARKKVATALIKGKAIRIELKAKESKK
jgi:predicted DNA-binding protein (UPF0251 family)